MSLLNRYITPRQLSEKLNVSRQAIYQAMSVGKIASVVIGNQHLIRANVADRWNTLPQKTRKLVRINKKNRSPEE